MSEEDRSTEEIELPDTGAEEPTKMEDDSSMGSEEEGADIESAGETDDKEEQIEGEEEDHGDVDGVSEGVDGVSEGVDDVSDKLELLIPNVLDTAEAANAAADVTAKAASTLELGLDRLHERADVLTEASKRSTVLSTRILIGSVTALVVSAFIYGFMAYQLATRTSQIDAMLMAVGKRIVKMNSALATFEDINLSIGKLADQQTAFEEAQSSVLEAVASAEKTVNELKKTVPEQAAEKISKNTDKVAIQINKLKQKVDGHSAEAAKFNQSVGELSRRMGAFEKKLTGVKSLNQDVAALVKLERERYLEALQKKAAIEEAQLRSQLEKEEIEDPSIIKYPKAVSTSNES